MADSSCSTDPPREELLPRRGSGVLPGVRLGRGRLGPLAGARGLPAQHARGRDVARGQRAGGVAVPGAGRLPCGVAVRHQHPPRHPSPGRGDAGLGRSGAGSSCAWTPGLSCFASGSGPGSASESRRSAVGGTRPRARADWSRQALEFLLQGPEFGGLRDRPWPPRWNRIPTTSARAARSGPERRGIPRATQPFTNARPASRPRPHAPRSPRSAASRPRRGAPALTASRAAHAGRSRRTRRRGSTGAVAGRWRGRCARSTASNGRRPASARPARRARRREAWSTGFRPPWASRGSTPRTCPGQGPRGCSRRSGRARPSANTRRQTERREFSP